ncbi:MAG: hypothetical protein ACD_58C00046G0001 [uncultured bacterium]|nr:MAG: hypothetical protein ACD_58C00046G0001 [uncultured bacterium]
MKRIFAYVYSGWTWNENNEVYDQTNGIPVVTQWRSQYNAMGKCNVTGDGPRPAYPEDYCGVKPQVFNVLVNGSSGGNVQISQQGSIQLTFNTSVDPEQLPLMTIKIDFNGDGFGSGLDDIGPIPWNAADRPDINQPHIYSHVYNEPGTYTPKIQIIDNWDWCNGGVRDIVGGGCQGNANAWTSFTGTITVR